MILLDTALEPFGIRKDNVEENKGRFYKPMNEERNKLCIQSCFDRIKAASEVSKLHEESEKFTEALIKNDIVHIDEYLKKLNYVPKKFTVLSRIVVLMDATGSMSSLIQKSKATVTVMFERAKEILQQQKIQEDCFQIHFAAYRSYPGGPEQLLLASNWTTKPNDLTQFL